MLIILLAIQFIVYWLLCFGSLSCNKAKSLPSRSLANGNKFFRKISQYLMEFIRVLRKYNGNFISCENAPQNISFVLFFSNFLYTLLPFFTQNLIVLACNCIEDSSQKITLF